MCELDEDGDTRYKEQKKECSKIYEAIVESQKLIHGTQAACSSICVWFEEVREL